MKAPMQDFLFYYLLAAGILCALIITVAIIVLLHRQRREEASVVVPVSVPVSHKKKKRKNKSNTHVIIPELWDKSNCRADAQENENADDLLFEEAFAEAFTEAQTPKKEKRIKVKPEKEPKKKKVGVEPLNGEEKGSLLLSALVWGVAVPSAFLGVFHMANKSAEKRAIKAKQPKKSKKKKTCNGNCKCCRSKCPFGKLGCKGRFAKL